MTPIVALVLFTFVLMFVLASTLSVNIGTLAFASVFIVGVVIAGLSPEQVLDSFPANLFVLLAGVTYLFAIAKNNGTLDWLTQTGLKLIRGNVALVPFVFAAIGLGLTAAGVFPGATIAILAPLALGFAARYDISSLLMSLVVLHGVQAGAMSPISPFGIIVNGAVADANAPDVTVPVFVNTMIINLLIIIVAYFLFGGLGLIRRAQSGEPTQEATSTAFASGPAATPDAVTGSTEESGDSPEEDGQLNRYQLLTLVGIAAVIVLAIGFGFNVGLAAFAVGAILTLLFPREEGSAIEGTAWAVVLLITGILTFIGVAREVGALEFLSDLIAGAGSPLLTSLLANFIGGITSAFAATAGVLAATLPILLPGLQEAGLNDISGAVTALVIASSVVDLSPISTAGALMLANVQNRDRNVFFRQLLYWAIAMLFVGSIVPWLILVVIGLPW